MGYPWRDIVIVRVIEEALPDDASGRVLHDVEFALSRTPPPEWVNTLRRTWARPSAFKTLHRPSICRVVRDRVILNDTTMGEVLNHHMTTLLGATRAANAACRDLPPGGGSEADAL